jgi:hypothetical protein
LKFQNFILLCFQVSISFDKAKAQPGDQVNVQVSADPMSVVNLLAVDQRIHNFCLLPVKQRERESLHKHCLLISSVYLFVNVK